MGMTPFQEGYLAGFFKSRKYEIVPQDDPDWKTGLFVSRKDQLVSDFLKKLGLDNHSHHFTSEKPWQQNATFFELSRPVKIIWEWCEENLSDEWAVDKYHIIILKPEDVLLYRIWSGDVV